MQAARRDASGRLYDEYSQEQVLKIVTDSHVPQIVHQGKTANGVLGSVDFLSRTALFLLPKHDRFSNLVGLNRCHRQR